ncbi:MAG: hypothetical protein WCJ64_03225 [Rhodospirillaceae bacterium]
MALSGVEILERLPWMPAENGAAAPIIFLTALDAILKGLRLPSPFTSQLLQRPAPVVSKLGHPVSDRNHFGNRAQA